MGTWVNTDKLIYNEQPVSEVIGEYQTIDHIGAHVHILTHEFAKNIHSQKSKVCIKYWAPRHIQTHDFTMNTKYWRL